MDSHNFKNNSGSTQSGYDRQEVSPARIFLYGTLGTIFLVIVLIFLMNYFISSKEELVYKTVLSPESAPLRELRAREEQELTSYRVLDAKNGIYQIPIERAMTLIADEAYQVKK